jgi:hypothetical protein
MKRAADAFSASTKYIDEGPSVLDGKRDAVKHCSGICLISKICGSNAAEIGGFVKEEFDKYWEFFETDAKTRQARLFMDYANNGAGHACARKGYCQTCFDCCLGELYQGKLVTLRPREAR